MIARWMMCFALASGIATAGPFESHPALQRIGQMKAEADRRLTLAVLVKDLALKPDQVKEIGRQVGRLQILLDEFSRSAASMSALELYPARIDEARSRLLRGEDPGLGSRKWLEVLIEHQRPTDLLYPDFEQATVAVRDLLDDRQKKLLLEFEPQRVLSALRPEDEALTEWGPRILEVAAMSPEVFRQEIDELVEEAADEIDDPEGAAKLKDFLIQVRKVPREELEAKLGTHARRIAALVPDLAQEYEDDDGSAALDPEAIDEKVLEYLLDFQTPRILDEIPAAAD